MFDLNSIIKRDINPLQPGMVASFVPANGDGDFEPLLLSQRLPGSEFSTLEEHLREFAVGSRPRGLAELAASLLLNQETIAALEGMRQRSAYRDDLTGMAIAPRNQTAPPPEPGNTPLAARDLGVLNGTVVQQEYVGVGDRTDYYRFTVASNSDLRVTLDGLSADADVTLIQDRNDNGVVERNEVLGYSVNPFTWSEEIAQLGLAAGTYLVQVKQYSGSTTYNLTLSTTPATTNFSSTYGYGLVDAAAAVGAAIGSPTPLPDAPSVGQADLERDLVNAPDVWNQGITGAGVVVAVVDTGVDFTHTDLDGNIWRNLDEIPDNGIDDDRNGYVDDFLGWDFADDDHNPMDLDGHGTHVAGAIAAERNEFGTTGVAPNAQIMPVRVLGEDGGSVWDIAAGIRYAVDNGAHVINLSLGGDLPSPTIASAIQYAAERNVAIAIAAGNSGGSTPLPPADLATTWGIAVGAVDLQGNVPSFSNRAGSVPLDYVVAPGVSVYSTLPNQGYGFLSGTSMATPHVAGVAALVRSANPYLTAAEVEHLVATTANAALVA